MLAENIIILKNILLFVDLLQVVHKLEVEPMEVVYNLATQPISFFFSFCTSPFSQGFKLAIKTTAAVLLALHAILFYPYYLLMLISQVLKNKTSN